MRILILYPRGADEIRNRKSALGSYILCLSDMLQRAGVDVWINNEPLETFNLQPVKETMRVKQSLLRQSISRFVPSFVKHRKRVGQTERNIERFEMALPSNVIFDHVLEYYTPGSTLGISAKKKYGCRFTVVVDAPVMEEYEFFYGRNNWVSSRWKSREIETIRVADQVVVYSQPMANFIDSMVGKKKNSFIHQNVDYTRFDFLEVPRLFPGEPVVIGFLGSFLKWHRVDMLLEVFNELRDENLNVKLLLVGYGQEWQSLQNQVAKSKHKEHISIPGFQDGVELLQSKRKIHIGVMPGSNWYGAPNKIFEYGAAGLAVVCPDTPTISFLFGQHNVVSFFTWDVKSELKSSLRKLIVNNDLRMEQAQRLQSFIRSRYTESITLEFYLKLLN